LRADLEGGRLPAAQALEIGLALTEALGHLHRNGLVHRDVKPSNVIFVNGRPKLADIGLVTDASDRCSIVGTEGYLPPEGPGTPQADIFALGKVLYEAVTGLDRREFPKLPEDLRAWPDRTAIVEFNEIVLRACAQNAERRYQTCDEMHAELALLEQGKSVRQKRTQQQRWVVCKRVCIGLAAVAAIAASVAILSRGVSPSAPSTDGPPSTNDAATALCTSGLLITRSDNYQRFAEAYTNFHQAIELDPRFARPYVGLLELRLRETIPALGPAPWEEIRSIALRLGKLAPNSAAAYYAQSIINYNDWDFPRAEESCLQAIKADPNYELGHTGYGFNLTHWGRPAEGRAQLKISINIASSKVVIYRMMAHTYFAERDYTNAIAWYRTPLGWDSHHSVAYHWLGESYLALGDYTNAIDNYRADDLLDTTNELETRRYYDGLLRAFEEGGPRGYWEHQWSGTKDNPNSDFYWKATIRIHLGDTNAALRWLNKSFETHEHQAGSYQETIGCYLLFDECWDGLHEDPRFKKLLDKIGFTKVMLSRKK
jgi:tetratricopeptide (TPR) repeat protein